MRRLLLLAMALFGLSAAHAQVSELSNGYCLVGAVSAITQGLPSTNRLMGVIPLCQITVYLHGTQTLATLYKDAAADPLANPFTATSLGFWQFYAANNAQYDVFGSGGVAPNTYPTPTLIPNSGGGGGGGSSPPQFSVQFALNNTGAFGSDPNITIDPVAHSFKVAGSGTGSVVLCGSTTGLCVTQTVNAATGAWQFTWPTIAPTATSPCMMAGVPGTGSWRYCVPGIDVTLATGVDIGAKINATVAGCSYACIAYVPPGSYPYSTTIILPLFTYGTYGLTLDPAAILAYTGAGDAIQSPIGSTTVTGQSQLIIQGGQLVGNASAANGVHLYPGNRITVRDMFIRGFTTGNGLLIEGANGVNVENDQISGNKVGVSLISTFCNGANPPVCSQSTTGSAYAPNNNRIDHDEIAINTQWGIFDDGTLAPGSGSLGNTFDHNDMELNGLGTSAYGAIQIYKSVGDVIGPGNYFEGSPREIVLGQYTGGAGDYFGASGPVVIGNFFTTQPPVSPATKAYNIELENTIDALIEGNSEQVGPGTGGNNCFLNAATGGESRTLIGRNAIFQNSPSGNQLCVNGTAVSTLSGTGSFTLFNPNFQAYMGYQSYVINTTVTSETIALGFTTANASCWLEPSAGSTTAINNGRASYLAGTSYLSALSTGSVTLTHPSGSAMQYDVICVNNPTGQIGTP